MSEPDVFSAWSVGAGRLLCAIGPPVQRLSVQVLGEVTECLDRIGQETKGRFWAVGYISYEAAPAFDESLPVKQDLAQGLPILEFLYFEPDQIREVRLGPELPQSTLDSIRLWPVINFQDVAGTAPVGQTPWLDSLDASGFEAGFEQTRERIEAGEFYQLNLTTRLTCQTPALNAQQAWSWFLMLHRLQPTNNALFLSTPGRQLISLSPELFFRLEAEGRRIVTAPMKGTRRPGDTRQTPLGDSDKDRAENVMIVDLLRNDLARVCEPRSVQVSSLFDVVYLPSVEQMTSSVTGLLRPGLALSELFRALFPCGSVTGAPKRQAMLAISELEKQTRSVYCGASGWINPNGDMQFNVPIRTLEGQSSRQFKHRMDWVFGTGSGLTWYSKADDERREWWQKTQFLRQAGRDFKVLETVRLDACGWNHFDLHFERMLRSARSFGFVFEEPDLRSRLLAYEKAVELSQPQKGRWLLSERGELTVELDVLPALPEEVDLELASQPLAVDPVWIVNKTTYRDHYDQVQIHQTACFDKLLIDAAGRFTETCRFNLVMQIGETLYTPRISTSQGTYLLPGVLRQRLLGDNTLQERELGINDLKAAARVWLINSLRGWIDVRRVLTEAGDCLFDRSAHPFDSK